MAKLLSGKSTTEIKQITDTLIIYSIIEKKVFKEKDEN